MDASYEYSVSSSGVSDAAAGAVISLLIIVYFIIFVITIIGVISLWKLFTKAGKPGWASIVPIYNYVVFLEVIGRPIWWLVLTFVPILQFWISIVMVLDFAKAYGKSAGYAVGMILLPVIFLPMLAFSKDTVYVGPVAEGYDGFGPAPDRQFTPAGPPPAGQPPVPPAPSI